LRLDADAGEGLGQRLQQVVVEGKKPLGPCTVSRKPSL
jgi:hypothetical protein